nr:hypothetical protein [Tanacetum cinerariifolium]
MFLPLTRCDRLVSRSKTDEARSPRVPVPFLEDPYEAIRQAYLVGTDTKFEPFEDPVETEAPESPHTVAPPTSLPDSTPPTLVPILRRTACMVVRVPPVMSSGLSTSIAKVAAMSVQCSIKVKDDDEEEDEEIEESLDSNSESEDAEEEGLTAKDEDPAAGDEGLDAGDEGPGLKNRQSIAFGEGRMPSVFEVDLEDYIAYIHVHAYPLPAPPAQTPPSPEWSSSLLHVSLAPSIVPSPISSPMIPLTIPSPVASPATAITEEMRVRLDLDEIVDSMRRG